MLDWHRRMGHLNIGSLREAMQTDKVSGIDLGSDLECEICLQGKTVRTPFPKKATERWNQVS